jgi:hypothetical protein
LPKHTEKLACVLVAEEHAQSANFSLSGIFLRIFFSSRQKKAFLSNQRFWSKGQRKTLWLLEREAELLEYMKVGSWEESAKWGLGLFRRSVSASLEWGSNPLPLQVPELHMLFIYSLPRLG